MPPPPRELGGKMKIHTPEHFTFYIFSELYELYYYQFKILCVAVGKKSKEVQQERIGKKNVFYCEESSKDAVYLFIYFSSLPGVQKYDVLVGWGKKCNDLLRKYANKRGMRRKNGEKGKMFFVPGGNIPFFFFEQIYTPERMLEKFFFC